MSNSKRDSLSLEGRKGVVVGGGPGWTEPTQRNATNPPINFKVESQAKETIANRTEKEEEEEDDDKEEEEEEKKEAEEEESQMEWK